MDWFLYDRDDRSERVKAFKNPSYNFRLTGNRFLSRHIWPFLM